MSLLAAALEVVDTIFALAGVHIEIDEKGEYYYEESEMKRWIAEADACDDCQDCADEEWVDMDFTYSSADFDADEPPLHPHCQCTIEQKTRRQRVYV